MISCGFIAVCMWFTWFSIGVCFVLGLCVLCSFGLANRFVWMSLGFLSFLMGSGVDSDSTAAS